MLGTSKHLSSVAFRYSSATKGYTQLSAVPREAPTYYPYTSYPDGLHTAYSERRADGSILFVFEWPLFMDMGTARCTIPAMTWDELHGVEEGDFPKMGAYVRENLELIEELADEATAALGAGAMARA